MKILQRIFPLIFVILLTVFALLPLFHSGFYTMHDDEQVGRLYDLDRALQSGHFPPRISPNLGFGYGYPFFNYYPSFAYYIGEIFRLMGFGYITSVKLMIAVGFIFSAIFMYVFTKELFGKVAGVIGAVSYTFITYHAVDVYVRGALAEATAFIFLPLVFWAFYKLSKNVNLFFISIGACGVGALILSHNLIAFMSAPFLALWLLYLLLETKNKKQFIFFSAVTILLGLGLSAYFWLPSYFEKDFTLVNILTSELASYNIHFVCLRQLWDSPMGYGGSIAGCYDGLSFEIGKIQLFLSSVAVILAGYYFFFKKKHKEHILIFIFGGMLLLSIFLMIKFSYPVWNLIPPLWYVQFPWRYLLFASFFVSVLSGAVFWFLKNIWVKLILALIICGLIIGINACDFSPQRFFKAVDNDYTNAKKIRWQTSSLAYEYVPKGIQTKKSDIGTTKVDIKENEISTSAGQVITGNMKLKIEKDAPHFKKFNIVVTTPGIFQINTYSFPGWNIYKNGKKSGYSDDNKLKLIRLELREGSYIIEAKFVDTPIRSIGNTTSLISIIILLGLVLLQLKRKLWLKN